MKSPRSLQLTLMMGAAATLTACSDSPTEQSFLSVKDCVAAGGAQELCQTAYDRAVAEHRSSAPKFASKEDCEKTLDVSQCMPMRFDRADGSYSDVFMPAMAGFLIANAVARQDDRNSGGGSGYSYGGKYYHSGPIYGSRDYPGSYRRSTELSGSPGRTSAPSIGAGSSGGLVTRPPNVGTTTISRQGFGSTRFSFGGSGS